MRKYVLAVVDVCCPYKTPLAQVVVFTVQAFVACALQIMVHGAWCMVLSVRCNDSVTSTCVTNAPQHHCGDCVSLNLCAHMNLAAIPHETVRQNTLSFNPVLNQSNMVSTSQNRWGLLQANN